MPSARRLMTALALMLVTGGTLAAQNPAAPTPRESAVSFAPFAASAAVGVHSRSSDMPAPIAPPRVDQHHEGVTLMIVGGAALLGGAIIGGQGGTLVMVGGVVCGAIGLYKYLN